MTKRLTLSLSALLLVALAALAPFHYVSGQSSSGNRGGGTAINATNNVIPKRSNAANFVDSALTDNGTSISSSEQFTWPTGLGAINHLLGATDAALTIASAGGQNLNINAAGAVNFGVAGGTGNYIINTTGLSPLSDNTRALGVTGGNSWQKVASYLYQTGTNCAAVGTAANPSVASCAAAIAGSFSCATNASTGTCTVNTTAITANSEIFITQRADTTTGTRLSVTCNTTNVTQVLVPTAVTAATSFTFAPGTITTNPTCYSYFIVN